MAEYSADGWEEVDSEEEEWVELLAGDSEEVELVEEQLVEFSGVSLAEE